MIRAGVGALGISNLGILRVGEEALARTSWDSWHPHLWVGQRVAEDEVIPRLTVTEAAASSDAWPCPV